MIGFAGRNPGLGEVGHPLSNTILLLGISHIGLFADSHRFTPWGTVAPQPYFRLNVPRFANQVGRLENIHVLEATSTNRTTILEKQHQGTMSTATSTKRTWYRTTFFNISVVSLCAFIAPGLWAAMNGLGGAGAADPHYVNAANSVIFCLQV
ncbi:DUF895 domain membrane protein [Aspergillus flavus]|nr:DUF895 domain membrane protein [Aspergillus flavus]